MNGVPTLLRIAGRPIGLVLLTAFLVTGCGSPKGEVSGTVTYQGQPVTVGTVTFVAAANNEVAGSSAISEGKYALAKVPVGPVKILVTTPPAPPPNARVPPKIKKLLPKNLAEKDSASVRPGGAPASRITVPAKYASPEQSGLTYTVEPGPQQFNIDLK